MTEDVEAKLWHLLVVVGAAGMVGALVWWWTSIPDGRDVRTAEVGCAVRNALDCDVPASTVIGPVVVAAVGALLVVVGVILRGQDTATPRT